MMAMPVIQFVKMLLSVPGHKIGHRVGELEKAVRKLETMCNQERVPDCFLMVEKIHIDKVIVEKIDLNNNFANLGIKDLSGTMNIGATYGPGVPPPENLKPDDCCENGGDAGAGTDKKEETAKPNGPKTTISYAG